LSFAHPPQSLVRLDPAAPAHNMLKFGDAQVDHRVYVKD
jgi:hypothetical protein